MFDNDGKEALVKIDDLIKSQRDSDFLLFDGSIRFDKIEVLNSGIRKRHIDKIDELERKLAAVMELLNITEVKGKRVGQKLVKGKKEVSLATKYKVYQPRISNTDIYNRAWVGCQAVSNPIQNFNSIYGDIR